MTVNVTWYDPEQTIVHYQFYNDWSWNTFYPAFEEAIRMETSVTHRVDVLIELPDRFRLPPNTISNMLSIANKQPENLGLSVIITSQRMIQTIYDVARRLSPTIQESYRFVPTMDEALSQIHQHRATTTNS